MENISPSIVDKRRVIFVFGSNLAGRHGAGAALYAKKHHGAMTGRPLGLQGDSYAIPTKGLGMAPLPLSSIKIYVSGLLSLARVSPDMDFMVTRVGCGLAGYTDADISPMFQNCPSNVILPKAWGGEGFDW